MGKIIINRKNIDYISEYNGKYIIYFNGGRHIEVPKEFNADMFETYRDFGLGTTKNMKGKTMKVDTKTYIMFYKLSDFVEVPLYEVENAD